MDPKITSSEVVLSNNKLSDTVFLVFCMVRKRFKARKIMANLGRMMSKHAKITYRVIGNMVFQHDGKTRVSLVVPKHYEFSCSSTPIHYSSNNGKNYNVCFFSPVRPSSSNDDKMTVSALEKILEMLDSEEAEKSLVLPGFGCTPIAQQLTITDSPYLPKNCDGDSHVDQKADEFIDRFYARLRLQM
ncbi:hypothetical protein ACHQM5_002044 [Ranunculus cassubicifolius]